METIHKRFLLFLVGCMGTRFFFVWLAKVVDETWLRRMGYLALLPAIGFFTIWLTGIRKTGPEVFGERIWWNHLRPVHGALYGLFAWFAIQGRSDAWMILLVDTLVGLTSFLAHHRKRIIDFR